MSTFCSTNSDTSLAHALQPPSKNLLWFRFYSCVDRMIRDFVTCEYERDGVSFARSRGRLTTLSILCVRSQVLSMSGSDRGLAEHLGA